MNPLPDLVFQDTIDTETLTKYETTLYSRVYNFGFSFNENQVQTAILFSRLCVFILFRLRNFNNLRNKYPSENFTHLIIPLIRKLDEIIHLYKFNQTDGNPSRQVINYNSIGIFFPTSNLRTNFLTFLDRIRSRLKDITISHSFRHYFISNLFDQLDIAYCLIQYVIYYFQPRLNLFLKDDIKRKLDTITRESFIQFKSRLNRRPTFNLV